MADEPTVTTEVLALIKQLQAQGQTGLLLMIGALALVLAASVWLIFLQSKNMAFQRERLSLVDLQLKAADGARSDISLRVDSLNKVNDELRKQVEGIRISQDEFRRTVNESITVGLEDIRDRLAKVTVTELLDQIPEEFKTNIQAAVQGRRRGR